MTPVFMFSVLCSTDDTSFHVFCTLLHWWHQFFTSVEQSIEKMKTGAIGGAEYLKHKNRRHQWSTSFHVFGTLLHWWHQFSCFRYSAPLMTPLFMFSVRGAEHRKMKTGVISGVDYRKHENWCHRWSRVPKT
jgi:hypothetical protein